jgi:hypothetical protein
MLRAGALSVVILLGLLVAGRGLMRLYAPGRGPARPAGDAGEAGDPAPKESGQPDAGRIRVVTRDAQGQGLAGAAVSCYSAESSRYFEALSDDRGTAMLETVPAGAYWLSAEHGNLISLEAVEVTVEAGGSHEAVLVLAPGLRLEGKVAAASGGKPLGNACLSLNAVGKTQRYLCGRSSADGSFSFGPLAPGKYTLTAAADGFLAEKIPWLGLEADQNVLVVAVELKRLVDIQGSVISRDGQPVADAHVDLHIVVDPKKTSYLVPSGIEAAGLPPPVSHPRLIASGHLGIMKGPVPDFPDAPAAAGPRSGLGPEALEASCSCMKRLQVSERVLSSRSGPDGAFSVSADPDAPFNLTVTHPGFAPQRLENLSPGSLGPDGRLTVTLDRGMELRGRIVDLGGRPPPDARLWMDMESFNIVADVAVEPDGSFLVEQTSGLVALHASAPGFSTEILRVDTAGHDPAEILKIVLVSDDKVLKGRVVDERGFPIGDARVSVTMAEPEGLDAGRTALSDADGVFSFVTLPPGPWRLAIDHAAYMTLEETVAAWEGEEEFALIEPGGICGTVTDDRTYMPADEFTLTLTSEKSITRSASFSGGSYAWTDVPAGRAVVEVKAPGYEPQERELSIPAGESKHECTLTDVDFWILPSEK